MSNINDLIESLASSNRSDSSLVAVNDMERDGNTSDVLFRFEQAANALSISGGTTLTNISPTTALQDLMGGRLTTASLLWLAIFAAGFWWLTRKK